MTLPDIAAESDESRGRGILTPKDRAYLRGEKTYEHKQSEHKREREMRARFRDSLKDFQVIAEEMTREERKRIFDLDNMAVATEVEIGVSWAIAVLHSLMVDISDDLQVTHDPSGHKSRAFELALRSGLKRSYLDEDLLLTDASLQVQSRSVPGIGEVRELLKSGHGVSGEVLVHLVETGEIDEDAFEEFIADQLDVEREAADVDE